MLFYWVMLKRDLDQYLEFFKQQEKKQLLIAWSKKRRVCICI